MYKINFNKKTIFILNHKKKNPSINNTGNYIIKEHDISSITEFLNAFKIEAKDSNLFIFTNNISQVFRKFSKELKYIKAAGGLTVNRHNDILMIFRNGIWDLPKGKLEKNEKISKAALREVEEECGISKLEIIKKLPSTYHIYEEKEVLILKKTYWFLMFSEDKTKPTPQTEENITKAAWINPKKDFYIFKNSYNNIKELLYGHLNRIE